VHTVPRYDTGSDTEDHHMHLTKRVSLSFAAITLALVTLFVAVRALAPTPGPGVSPTTETVSSNLLSGTVTGLDPGDGVRLHLEELTEGQVEGRGEIVQRFNVINGRWQHADLPLPPGHYRLVPEAEGYAHIPHSVVFQIPEERFVWRYTNLDFEFLRPADAMARLGLPLCSELSSPVIAVTAVPEGTPAATSQPESMPPGPLAPSSGMCYANHLVDIRLVPAGLQGRISGLPEGQMATISLYALPPAPGEHYGQGEPPAADSSGTHPLEVSQLASPRGIALDWPLVATLRVGNGPWGLVDPSLVGSKYLVMASAPGRTVDPPAYEVVIFAGKAPGFPGGIDFTCLPGDSIEPPRP
jgi:hypothetical protein